MGPLLTACEEAGVGIGTTKSACNTVMSETVNMSVWEKAIKQRNLHTCKYVYVYLYSMYSVIS